MSEPDFSGVDPLRVPEARRRIAVLDQYLALPSPTTADAVRLGQEIGLSRWQLQRLAAVWRDHRDVRLMVVGKRGASNRDYGIAPRAIEIANAVIASSATDRSVAELSVEIEAACAAEGLAPPSRPTIYTYVRKARSATPASGPARIVIGRLWFHLPVKDHPVDSMPTLLAAVLLPEGLIVAHRVSTDPLAPPSVADLVSEVADLRTADAPARAFVIDADDRRVADAVMQDVGLGAIKGHRQSVQREMSRAFNGRLGPLDALTRRAKARPATRKAETRFEKSLDAAEVIAAIEGATASHNAAQITPVPAFDIASN